MKKGLRILLALFALMGAMNCFILESAFAIEEEAVCLSDDGCDCHFVCCSFDHQIFQSPVVPFTPSMTISEFIPLSTAVRLDVPAGFIFHPPVVR